MAPPSEDAALLRALRAATTSVQRDKAISAILDRLATTRSVPETQRLLDALLGTSHTSGLTLPDLLPRLQQVACVCTSPPRKADAVGQALTEALVAHVTATSGHPETLRVAQETLVAVCHANAAVLGGILSAIDSVAHTDLDATNAMSSSTQTALDVTRPVLVAVLLDTTPQGAVQKLALVQSLVRTAWSTDDRAVRALVTRIVVRAVQFTPLSTSVDVWTVYPVLVAAAVDLVVAGASTRDEDSLTVAQAVLRRVFVGLANDLSVVSLLQSLVELAAAAPTRLGSSSSIVFQLGAVLLHAQSAVREQSLVLRVLRVLTEDSATAIDSSSRSVYLEALLVPLVAVQATHPQDAPVLLQRVLDTASTSSLQCADGSSTEPAWGVDAAHAASFLALVASPRACEAWLRSLFHDKNPEIHDPTSTLLLQLGACLMDRRGDIRMLALDALERQLHVRRAHKHADWTASNVKLLVSTLVVLTSYCPVHASTKDQPWLSKCFHVLASLAATTTETMKIMLRLIKRMATSTPRLQPQALHLMLLVWKQDSRVYPQLENVLHQAKDAAEQRPDDDEDTDAEIVRMATILAMCEKDPETGVEWIADVQGFLEHDSVSIVAMAVRAVTLLCIADCLDYETTVKIVVVKIKKNKITCADNALFQQELCKFYAFGGACGFVDSSPKYSARVLSDLWEYAEAEDADVRVEAFVALNSYALEALGLRFTDTTSGPDDDDDDDDELTEQDVEENVDRVWIYLQTEKDDRVRLEVEHLVQKVLDAESKKLAPGGASRTGTGLASAAAFAAFDQRVSAAATKELKKQLPTREGLVEDVIEQTTAWSAYLLAYEPANVVESGAATKRKDKRLRLVMGHVDEMKSSLDRSLVSSTAAVANDSKNPPPIQFLHLLQSVDAWNSFARKYFGRLEELAALRTPMDAPEGHTAGVLSSLIDEQVMGLLDESNLHRQKWLVIGAIVHQACLSASSDLLQDTISKARAALRSQLQQSMEELRVFKDAKHAVDMQYLLLGLVLTHPTESEPHLDALVPRVLAVVNNEGPDLMRAAAILFVGHASALFRSEETRAVQRQRLQSGIVCAVTIMLRPMCGDVAASIATKVLSGFPVVLDLADYSKGSSTTTSKRSVVLSWASAIALAHLSQRLAAVHRLTWLDNLRGVLENVWAEDPTFVGAVALGPVLLESVYHNRVDATALQGFASTLQRRLDDAPADVVVVGVIALPYVTQRLGTYDLVSSRNDVEAFLQSLERGRESSSASVLAVAAGNLLHGSTGVTLFGTTTVSQREVMVDSVTVERLMGALNELKQLSQLASDGAAFTLAGIADRADSFCVVQKNKAFDVQINTLPATSLVFKTLDFLRVGGPTTTDSTDRTAFMNATQSALRCIAHAARSLPLPLDLSPLALRVASRYAVADDILAASIDLAASHASGVSLLMANMMAPERLLNYAPRVVEACVNAVVTTRGRLTQYQLITLLARSFDALVECWHRDSSCSVVKTAFEKWINFTGSLVATTASKEGDTSTDDEDGAIASMVSTLVLGEIVTKLPFTPDHEASKLLLGQFARVVLAKITPRTAVTDSVLAATSRTDKSWAWWRAGSMLCELLRIGAISSSSIVFRWLLQLDFSRIEGGSVVESFTANLVDAVSVAAGKKSVMDVNEPWLLELLDAVASTTEQSQDAVLKRRVLSAVVDTAVSWTELRGHEALVLRGEAAGLPHETMATSMPALMARALVLNHHERSKASASLAQRFWTLQANDGDRVDGRKAAVRELYVLASESRPRVLSSDVEKALAVQLSME